MKLTEKKRKDILEAAIQEFREQGFPSARVNRIAELAEVSKRTLYKHFESKEVLFQAITDILLEQIAATPKLRYDPHAPLREQLIAAARDYIAHLSGEEYMGLNRLVMSELRAGLLRQGRDAGWPDPGADRRGDAGRRAAPG